MGIIWTGVRGIRNMKKILFIFNKRREDHIHASWRFDCSKYYKIKMWGKGYNTNLSRKALQNVIDNFCPDYIYMTMRKHYYEWLPDLNSVHVPKIFVEVDSSHYSSYDDWYKQFDVVMCRQPCWGQMSRKYHPKMGSLSKFNQETEYQKTWEHISHFRWSVSKSLIYTGDNRGYRKGIYFLGNFINHNGAYEVREDMSKKFINKIEFITDKKRKSVV